MANQFHRHYTVEEARAMLPQVRTWLTQLRELRDRMQVLEEHLIGWLQQGRDVGGDVVNRWVRGMADIKDVLAHFYQREIQVKDLDRGLVDFPSFRNGKEVFLCWEQDEEDIQFWHDLDAGFAGRDRL